MIPRARLGLAVLCLLGLALAPRPSAAAPTEISFQGVVETVPDHLAGGSLAIGSEVTGTLVIERSTPDASPSASFGNYLLAVLSFDLSIGPYDWTIAPPANVLFSSVRVSNNFVSTPPTDRFTALASLQGSSVNGRLPEGVSFSLSTYASWLSSDSIPTANELNRFPFGSNFSNDGWLDFAGLELERVEWRVTSLVAVPEPAALLLIGLALAAVHGARRYRA